MEQGMHFLARAFFYSGESVIVAVFGNFVLCYSFCEIWQRLLICPVYVRLSVALEVPRCGIKDSTTLGTPSRHFYVGYLCGLRHSTRGTSIQRLAVRDETIFGEARGKCCGREREPPASHQLVASACCQVVEQRRVIDRAILPSRDDHLYGH